MATRGGFLVGDHNTRPRRPVRYLASKQTKLAKRKKKKPEWDSTVNDLNVHKATKEEQIKRHEIHKSKNAGKVQLLSQQKDKSLDSTIQTPDTVERRKLAIVQEVLYGQDKFQDVLSESDKAMSVVKDLFGDDPKKFMGFPNITAAPSNSLNGKEHRFPVAEMPETPTHLSLLSDSVMRTPALNELPGDANQDEFSPGSPPPGHERKATSSFQPMLDLQRFQQYVAEEQNKYLENHTSHANGSGSGHVLSHGTITAGQATIPSADGTRIANLASGFIHGGHGPEHVTQHGSIPSVADQASQPLSFLSHESGDTVIAGGPNFVKPVSLGESTTNSSIPSNARLPSSRSAVTDQQPGPSKRDTRSKTSDNPPTNSSSTGLQSLDDLKKMVEELETAVAAYEHETGRQQTNLTSASAGSFSGYTASLINAVTKLMGYLKESEIQRKADMVMREQVLQGFEEQRALVDALTNDILHTQEQNLALQYELLEYRKTTDDQLQYLKRELFAVLKSHEYQALSSSINTLYSLNPVALKEGAVDVLHPLQHENHGLEYLPGAPVSQADEKQEQESTERTGADGDLTADSRNKPSFMSQYSAWNRMAASPVFHKHNPVVISSSSVPPNLQDNSKQQQSMVPTVAPVPQLPHNGHAPLVYPYSGSSSLNNEMPGHGHISSNIVMYPPSQVYYTQASSREATTSKPHSIVPGVPNRLPVQNQHAPPGTKVVHTVSSSVSPLYSSRQQMAGKASINAQVQIETAQPAVSEQPDIFNTMQPMPGVPQGLPQGKPAQAASPRLSHEVPSAYPQEDSRLASPNQVKNPESIRQGAAAVTSVKASDLKHKQEQPPRQVHVQPASKSRGFAPVSRTMIGGLPANHQLKERLQNLANRQKTLTGKSGHQDFGSVHQNKGESKEVQPPRPSSPHVHFQDPPVSMNGLDSSKQHQHSPPVSPIPYKNPAVLRSNAPSDKRVVVNLPNAWSDVSSTISL